MCRHDGDSGASSRGPLVSVQLEYHRERCGYNDEVMRFCMYTMVLEGAVAGRGEVSG